jgi:beta-mannosidase
LRIWGGGLYESKAFYDLADQMGIMIWHDFMFACSVYQTNLDFLDNVAQEVRYQVSRLRNHPSIVLWAGNNENEVAVAHNWYNTNEDKELYYSDYRKLYVDVLKENIRKVDAEESRPYLVSSPTNGKKSEEDNHISENPYDWRYGDVHFYNYEINGWVPENFPNS